MATVEAPRLTKLLTTVVAVALVSVACTVDDELVNGLPWLKKGHHFRIAATGGSPTVYSVRTLYFFWHELDVWDARMLDPHTAVTLGPKGVGVLHEGRSSPEEICPPTAQVSMPRHDASVFDCISATLDLETNKVTGATFKRFAASGQALVQANVMAVPPGNVLNSKLLTFYDELGHPYFLSLAPQALTDDKAHPDCALISINEGGLSTVTSGPEAADRNQCEQASTWKPDIPHQLRRLEYSYTMTIPFPNAHAASVHITSGELQIRPLRIPGGRRQ